MNEYETYVTLYLGDTPIESIPIPVKVRYSYNESYPGTRETPEEPAFVEIESILMEREKYIYDITSLFSDKAMKLLSDEIMEAALDD